MIFVAESRAKKMEYSELILNRESIRNYDPNRPVPMEILEKILEAGRLAPSAKNYQPWKGLLISSAPLLEKVKACYQRDWIKDAPHILILMGLKNEAWTRGYDGYNSVHLRINLGWVSIGDFTNFLILCLFMRISGMILSLKQ